MTGFYDRMHIYDAAVTARTIVVDTGTVKATDFDLDRDTRNMLFGKGREAAERFLDGAPGQADQDKVKRHCRPPVSPRPGHVVRGVRAAGGVVHHPRLSPMAIALDPLPLTAFLVVLPSKRGVRNGAAFLFGWLVSLAIVVTAA